MVNLDNLLSELKPFEITNLTSFTLLLTFQSKTEKIFVKALIYDFTKIKGAYNCFTNL